MVSTVSIFDRWQKNFNGRAFFFSVKLSKNSSQFFSHNSTDSKEIIACMYFVKRHWLLDTNFWLLYSSILKFTDKFMYFIYDFGIVRTIMFDLLTIAEMLLFKIFYMHSYSRIAGVNEYFLTNFVTSFNIIIVFGFYIIRICLEEHVRTRLYYKNYAKPYEAYMKVHFP